MSEYNISGIELNHAEYAVVNSTIINFHATSWNRYTVVEKQDIIHDIIGR